MSSKVSLATKVDPFKVIYCVFIFFHLNFGHFKVFSGKIGGKNDIEEGIIHLDMRREAD